MSTVDNDGGENNTSVPDSSPKRKRLKTSDQDNPIPATQGDGPVCPICLDSWSSTGNHRLVSLKCGHLFGMICIEKWLSGGAGKCPQCNGPAKKSDIRAIYAKVICAVDNHERDDALRLLEAEKLKRSRLEQLHLKTSMQCQMYVSENTIMRKKIQELETKIKFLENPRVNLGSHFKHGLYLFKRSISVSHEKPCSVFDSDSHSGILAVAKKLENAQTQNGVLKISSIDSYCAEFISIHSNQIRDMKFNPEGSALLLTCSKDKDVKLTCLKSNSNVLTYHTGRDTWCCNWSSQKSNVMFCGLQNGEVLVYDIRNTRDYVDKIVPSKPYQKCPVISINSLHNEEAVSSVSNDILIGTLQGLAHYSKNHENEFCDKVLQEQAGALSSVSYEPEKSMILVTYKPGSKNKKERHVLMKLDVTTSSCEELHSFEGSPVQSLRSRTCLLECPDKDGHALVCAGDQSNNTVNIWSTKDNSLMQTLNFSFDANAGTIVSVAPQRAAGFDYLVVLTSQRIHQYKWNISSMPHEVITIDS